MINLFNKDFEIINSSYYKLKNDASYTECKNFSCNDIITNLTHFDNISLKYPNVIEIPENTDFHFLVRIPTNINGYDPDFYYNSFKDRKFISFSTINRKNISHYNYEGRNTLLAYDIVPSSIVHVFPIDSDLDTHATSEDMLTSIPSLWLTLDEIDNIALKLQLYTQITCKTKINGKIIRPFAAIAINNLDDITKQIAKDFGIACIIIHPDKDAISNCISLYDDYSKTQEASKFLENNYNISVKEHYHSN